jgi:hypothetical protein
VPVFAFNNQEIKYVPYFYWGTLLVAQLVETALQTGRSRDRFPIVSLELSIEIILSAAL